MEWYEIAAIMKYGYKKHMTEYECARTQAYVTAQVNSKKPLTPQSIMKFEWDDKKNLDKKNKHKNDSRGVSEDDLKRLNQNKERFLSEFKTLPPMN